jgi:uncharacterized surface protein with fasciclin (FAS1) repeats
MKFTWRNIKVLVLLHEKAKAGVFPLLPIFSLLITIFCTQCKDNDLSETFYSEDELLISAYLEEHSSEFSTLVKVLEITDLKSVLNAYGHYTFFAPDNEAFVKFCEESGHTSVEEFDKEFLTALVKFHLLNKDLETTFLPNGVLGDTSFTGDNLVFSFLEGGLHSITINGEATITGSDIKVSNGHINKINRVLNPVFLSIYDKLKSDPKYSIFSTALELTGLKDTLETNYVPELHGKFMKTRFTVMAEPDSVFNSYNIFSIDDLVAKYSDSGDLIDPSNGLNKFVAYHCLPGLFYLNQLDSFNYQTLAKNSLLSISIKEDIFLNEHFDGVEQVSIGISKNNSNRSAKNGVIHSIDKVMEVYEPEPKYFVFDFTSYQGINLGETYLKEDLENIYGIKAENSGIWYRMSMLDEDSSYIETTSSKVGWNVEFNLPVVMKGQYRVVLHWVSTQNRCTAVQAFWDGEILGDEFSMLRSKRPPQVPPEWLYDFHFEEEIGRIILDETSSHTIKFYGLAEGYGDWDYIAFWPV